MVRHFLKKAAIQQEIFVHEVGNMGLYKLKVERQYYERLDPFSKYSERKFIQRYRLSKAVVKILIKNYVDSLTTPLLRGIHAVPHSLMVNIL